MRTGRKSIRTAAAMFAAVSAVVLMLPLPHIHAAGASDTQLLLVSYLRLSIAQQIPAQAAAMTQQAGEEVVSQVKSATTRWMKDRIGEIREGLDSTFGDKARAIFEQFITAFASAEERQDEEFLRRLADDAGIQGPPPQSFSQLREQLIETRLKQDVVDGSHILGEIQTWMDLRDRQSDVPPLSIWISRSEKAATGSGAGERAEPADPLEAAEAEWGEYDFEDEEYVNPLDSFNSSRKAKRDKKLAEAQAGMQQIAQERAAAEEEYAQKKMASAQADAEAMKRHAEELAAVEQQALEQRQRSWGNRLKGIIGTAAGSFGGAFLGGVGSRAAEEALDSVWPTQ